LQDRGYAYLDKKRFVPTDLGRLVNGFLIAHFDHYIDYDFTARMEDQLDFISNGKREWVPVLSEFWGAFSNTLSEKQDVARGVPLAEKCPKCSKGELFLQNSRRGLFVGCNRYPKCDYTRPWGSLAEGPMKLGADPATQKEVLLMRGPYGFYVQLGPTEPNADTKPKRAAWPKNIPVATADLDTALKLLSLPRQLGVHPQSGKPVEANIGPFGPYVKHDGGYKSIPKSDSVYDITLARAVELLAAPKSARGAAGKPLGTHPEDQKPITLMSGRYGPYVKHGQVNATVPRDYDSDSLTFEQALEILAAKSAKAAPSTLRRAVAGAARTPAAKRTARPKPAVKKKPARSEPGARPAANKGSPTKTRGKTRTRK